MEKIASNIKIECIKGNIVTQSDISAIVNAANAQLRIGGGVAGAIHRAAGPNLEKECRPLAPIKPGEAVITKAYKLPNDYVIHCLGPVYGVDKPEDKILAACYRNALKLSEENQIDSVAFPSISTGAFGYPMLKAAKVAFETIIDIKNKLIKIKLIRFVLFSDEAISIHKSILNTIISN